MPRAYGRFTTSIWNDEDFTSLNLEQQAVYFTLGLQPDVTAAGTLPLTSRRWARLSAGTDRDKLEKVINDLVEHPGRHLVIDEDTEELLIRKFIKWDQGYTNSKRLPVILDAARGAVSVDIQRAIVDELTKLGLADAAASLYSPAVHALPDALSDGVSDALSDRASNGRRNGLSDGLSDAISASDRVVVTLGESDRNPLTATREPVTAPHTPRDTTPSDPPVGPPPMFCSKHPDGTEEPCGPCGTARKVYAEHAQARLAAEVERRRRADQRQTDEVLRGIADARANATPRPTPEETPDA